MTAVHNLGFNIVYRGKVKHPTVYSLTGRHLKKNNYVNIQDKKIKLY